MTLSRSERFKMYRERERERERCILNDIFPCANLSLFHKHHPANLSIMKPSIRYVVIKVVVSEQS